MRDQADMIANLNPSIPLIADMDSGYGGPVMVARAVEQYIRAGVAGFHIEDQVITKRCGHLSGKQIVTQEEFIARIRAAVATRRRLNSDIVIIARTDALQSLGYENAVSRLKAAKEVGADVGFFEGLTSKEMGRKVCKELAPWPMLLNMVEHGATPSISRDEARELGFKVMIWSFATLAPAYRAIRAAMQHMKQTGTSNDPPEMTPRKLFEVCGLDASMKIDEEAGGHAYAKL
jgi:2-methylisocitrate lyase-like PEP mutase family enzyme